MGNVIPNVRSNVIPNVLSNVDPLVTDRTWYSRSSASTGNVTSGQIGASEFTVNNGTHKISTQTVGGKSVQSVECVVDGIFYIPTSEFKQSEAESAYGSWRFCLNKSLASNTNLVFIASEIGGYNIAGQDGYTATINTAGDLVLFRIDNAAITLLDRYNGGISASVDFCLDIQRDRLAGEFKVYIDGVLRITTTDNTNTESAYMNIDNRVGEYATISEPYRMSKAI